MRERESNIDSFSVNCTVGEFFSLTVPFSQHSARLPYTQSRNNK